MSSTLLRMPPTTRELSISNGWLKEKVEEGDFALLKIHIDDNGLDMLTKVLATNKLSACRNRVGLLDFPISE